MRAVTIDSDLATLFTFTPRKPPITPIQGVLLSAPHPRNPCPMLLPVPTIASLLAAALALNLHYVLLGRPFLEGPLTSRPVLAAGNAAVGKLVRRTLTREGVPEPDRTETYSDGTSSGRVDIYEPEAESVSLGEPRTAIVYFHSGAFIAGHRSFGAGVCGFFASHGAVCLSASYRLTNSGDGVAGCIQDAWAVLRWTRANAGRLNINPSRVVVAGDSAGGLLATSLGTGLRVGAGVAASEELPAAVIGTSRRRSGREPARGQSSCSFVL